MSGLGGEPRSDLAVLLEDGQAFVCFICGHERERLFRVRLPQWSGDSSPRSWDEACQIRRRLICGECLGSFDYADAGPRAVFINAITTIAGRGWCLRLHPHQMPTSYTRDSWSRYVSSVIARRGH